jgi:hypothetical protein
MLFDAYTPLCLEKYKVMGDCLNVGPVIKDHVSQKSRDIIRVNNLSFLKFKTKKTLQVFTYSALAVYT